MVKGSFIMGIGANNVVKIKTDHKYTLQNA